MKVSQFITNEEVEGVIVHYEARKDGYYDKMIEEYFNPDKERKI